MKHAPTRITYRFAPCPCGCGGTDRMHRANYWRVIRDITRKKGITYVIGLGFAHFTHIGYAKLPHCKHPIRVVRLLGCIWAADYTSITTERALATTVLGKKPRG